MKPLTLFFWNEQVHIDSTMGRLSHFGEVMEQVSRGYIRPLIDSVFEMEQAREAYARYKMGEQFGKIVLKIRE